MEKNCAFQYAYKNWDIHIEQDTDLITLDEAKELYRKYLPDFIKEIAGRTKSRDGYLDRYVKQYKFRSKRDLWITHL